MRFNLKHLFMASLALAFVLACSTPTPEEQQQLDIRDAEQAELEFETAAIIGDLVEIAPRAAHLLEKSWEDTLTPEEADELAVLLVTGPAGIHERHGIVVENMNRWWQLQTEKNDIREKAGGGWWEEVLYAGAGLLVGMGAPTSGPLAPLLYRLQPFLQALGLRNEQKRVAQRAEVS